MRDVRVVGNRLEVALSPYSREGELDDARNEWGMPFTDYGGEIFVLLVVGKAAVKVRLAPERPDWNGDTRGSKAALVVILYPTMTEG